MQQSTQIAIAIFCGFILVAGAIFFSGGIPLGNTTTAAAASPIRTDNAHIYGDAKAPIRIVEFSDMECPFCSRVHPTIERIVDESNGEVAWEYRHLPLPSHRSAEFAAIVSECVAESAGNEAFWQFLNEVFMNQSAVSEAYLTTTALQYGISESDLATCVADPAMAARVAKDMADARAFGGSGTPYSLIIFPDGGMRPVSGALPYEQWQALLTQ